MQLHINSLLEKIKTLKVAIYGDFCLDAYWIMDPKGSEVSVETGQQAESIARHYYSPGGAGNVTANVAALKPKAIKAIGVIGDDIHGRELTNQLLGLGIDTSALVIQKTDFDTYSFCKKHLGEQETLRTDFGVNNKRSKQTDKEIVQSIRLALENYDVLIFNQQIPGSLNNPTFIREVNALFKAYSHKTILLDSRHYTHQFQQVSLKLNEVEVAKLDGNQVNYRDHISSAEIELHGSNVFKKYQQPIFITCGSRGIISIDANGVTKIPGIQLLTKTDSVGAGDTALSALALALGAACTAPEAARFANFAAAVSVQKVFTTGTASSAEIMEISQEANFIYQPELAKNSTQANYFEQSEIEVCDASVLTNLGQIKHAVFDHDGTISILREGWEKIMEPVMIRSILGEQLQQAGSRHYEEVRRRVLEYIDQSTGIQTIVQMEALVKMVDEFDIVPKTQILDKYAYKEIFNDALLEMVNRRKAKFERGELKIEDVIIKGALTFLKSLKRKGISCYLASGTDQEDVIKEAQLLGYANLFDGGIHGSVGDIKKYSKKMVLDKIIAQNQLKGAELLVIGDGPVEIQACRKVGGVAVGIACDEPRRYGLNLEKRKRLIRAGAHFIIPDFSQNDSLLELLLTD